MIFTGSFFSSQKGKNIIAMRTLSYAVTFNASQRNVYFMKHDGYFGALGSFLSADEKMAKL